MKVSFKKWLNICLISGSFAIVADEIKNIVKNGDFEEGGKYWNIPRNVTAKFQRGIGRNQSAGVEVTVTPERRGLVIQTLTGFEPRQKYKVTAWIKRRECEKQPHDGCLPEKRRLCTRSRF